MCSGKSTLGKALAEALDWSFLDVDRVLEEREGMSIPEIFERRGEEYFRKREFEVLKELSNLEKVVISTGGGLGANIKAMELMKSKGLVVWLKLDFETFLERCAEDSSRPLLRKSKEELIELMKEREKVYSLSHLSLDSKADCEENVKKILLACQKSYKGL